MKRFLIYLSICAAASAGFIACGSDKESSEEIQKLADAAITSSKDTIEAAGGTFTVTVDTKSEYSVIVSRTAAGWLAQTGSSNNVFTYAAAENTSGMARYVTISAVNPDNLTLKSIEIVQKANEVPEEHSFSVDPLAIEAGADETSATFSVLSDVDWTVASDNSSFVVDKPSGSGNATVKVTFPANTSASAKTANIQVSTENKGVVTSAFTVVITQKGFAYTFGVDNQTISVDAAATSASFNVTGNVDWTVSSDNTSFVVTPSSGSGAGTVNVTFPANTSATIQSAKLTVSATNEGVSPKSYTVTITQSKAISFTVIAKWKLASATATALGTHFSQSLTDAGINNEGYANQYIDANVSGTGQIMYWSVDKSSINTSYKFRRTVGKYGEPLTYGQWIGDYWYFSATPSSAIEAGSTIKIQFATRASATGQKYWIIEYKDGTVWKPIKATTHGTIAKDDNYAIDQSFDYNFEYGGTEVLSEISETAVLSSSTSLVEIRMRCVANERADGTATLAAVTGGVSRLVGEEGSNMDVQSKTGVVISYGK